MFTEKGVSFGHAWFAMSVQAFAAAQEVTLFMMKSLWSPWSPRSPGRRGRSIQWTPHLQSAMLGVLDKGLVPVRRKAVANARRLSRTRLR